MVLIDFGAPRSPPASPKLHLGGRRSIRRLVVLFFTLGAFLLLDVWWLFGENGLVWQKKVWDSGEAEAQLVALLVRTNDALDRTVDVQVGFLLGTRHVFSLCQ